MKNYLREIEKRLNKYYTIYLKYKISGKYTKESVFEEKHKALRDILKIQYRAIREGSVSLYKRRLPESHIIRGKQADSSAISQDEKGKKTIGDVLNV